MAYLPGLAVAIAAFWFALSRETGVLFIVLASFSVLATLWLAAQLNIVDRDTSPYHRIGGYLAYAPWLLGEVFKANLQVAPRVFRRTIDIEPALLELSCSGRTDQAITAFANSITLTPGTVTVDTDRGRLLVHALDAGMADPAAFADMGERARRAADGGA